MRMPRPYRTRRRRNSAVLTRRSDLAGVHPEPVYAAHVASMLDLEAPVHHDVEPASLGDLDALGADHAVLEPQRVGADRDRLARDLRHRVGSAEDVDDV